MAMQQCECARDASINDFDDMTFLLFRSQPITELIIVGLSHAENGSRLHNTFAPVLFHHTPDHWPHRLATGSSDSSQHLAMDNSSLFMWFL